MIGIGSWMLLHRDADDEEHSAGQLITARGTALLGLDISISLDGLAIGFSLGLRGDPAIEANEGERSDQRRPSLLTMPYGRSSRPAFTSARSAPSLSGVTARCPRSGLLLSRMPAAPPAGVVPTSTQSPCAALRDALTHLIASIPTASFCKEFPRLIPR